ncbi:Lar family restriction alleviation protein [Rhizobium sp. PL01]|uniref:Lar family restriction alleviation protein n=1 Tax=Rhizobium sp. PL01 TaxID=3085631 RepID=UPI0039925C6C
MSAPLLPCPFCGTKPYISQPMAGAKWWEVSCSDEDCGAMGQSCPNVDDAIAVWNRRTPPPADQVVSS